MSSEKCKEMVAKQSTIRIGDVVPNFKEETTFGPIDFHEALGGSWAVLCSHPGARTPICTTELASIAKDFDRFQKMGIKVFVLSVDSKEDNDKWTPEIASFAGVDKVQFPIICDTEQKVSSAYGILDQNSDGGSLVTLRSIFFINPEKKCVATIFYPGKLGRNSQEIFRVFEGLQLMEKHNVVLPVDWSPGKKVVLPTKVSTEDAKEKYGDVEVIQPYLRFVNDPSK